ncbi:uncharacterized protein C2845_PM06G19210 [Panicum miliaceum]|uniref:PWWP domain-containing protein n=1 Tax=Panicum miliaceum TaxID=4540 RepID=A0A3L6RBN8_PANMI|nr:uncharacterized protein C2845_PM06G19210 [Panicum miliaceum]
MEGKLGVESGGLQSEEEAAAKIVERSAYHTSQHAEAEPKKSDQSARYRLPHLDSGDIRVSDLVRGKFEGYNWWPGEFFDPSDASELALKHQISGNHLGFPELATFQTTSGRAENAMDVPSTKNVEEDVSSIVDSNYDKSREGIRSPRKQKPEVY